MRGKVITVKQLGPGVVNLVSVTPDVLHLGLYAVITGY
jgi:hypothetical protein